MKDVITHFDQFLKKHELSFEAIIIGGAALIIMDVITRATRDVDFLDPEIPQEIKKASVDFAKKYPEYSLAPESWLNNGPITLIRDLPKGWRNDLQVIFKGSALTLFTLGRLDLLRSKLYACADRDIDYQDCLALSPTKEELLQCKEWVLKGDANPLWPKRVEFIFQKISKDLKYE